MQAGLEGLVFVNNMKCYCQRLASTSSIVPTPDVVSVSLLSTHEINVLFVVKKKTPLKYSVVELSNLY